VPDVIDVAGVTKIYRAGDVDVDALRGIDLAIREGEYVAITGESGSGKTTLLGILGCLDRPTDGSYRLLGEEMATLPETQRAHVRGSRIGFVFQAYNLLPRATAYKNVELPLVYARVPSRERRVRVLEALAEVGLADRADHRPNQLSGGQQQRVGIARALVTRPSVLLADEPTGNLDSQTSEEIMALFHQLNDGGRTIIMVTHDEDVASHAKRIIRLRDGRIVDDQATGRG
jgi:putative ABC transport system ATP-binding protein